MADLAVDVDAAAGAAADEKTPSALDGPSALVSRAKAAKAAGVSRASLERFDKVVGKAPELQTAIAEKTLSVSDAAVLSEEAPELRRRALDDVREGRASTGAKAVEQRTGRAPKARTVAGERGRRPGRVEQRTGRAPKARSRLKESPGAKAQVGGADACVRNPPRRRRRRPSSATSAGTPVRSGPVRPWSPYRSGLFPAGVRRRRRRGPGSGAGPLRARWAASNAPAYRRRGSGGA